MPDEPWQVRVESALNAHFKQPDGSSRPGTDWKIGLKRGNEIQTTIVRAYLAAGQPDKRPTLASYAAWSDLVRSALVWAGCGDPVETMTAIRDTDPVLTTLRTVLEC